MKHFIYFLLVTDDGARFSLEKSSILRKGRIDLTATNEQSLWRGYPQTFLGGKQKKNSCSIAHTTCCLSSFLVPCYDQCIHIHAPLFYAVLWAVKCLSPVERLLLSPITFSFAPSHALAHGKYIFQKQRLKFIFQAVESACLTLIQFFSQGTSGVELKCTKLRYRFFCLFEPGIRSLEEFVRGGWEIMCVEWISSAVCGFERPYTTMQS